MGDLTHSGLMAATPFRDESRPSVWVGVDERGLLDARDWPAPVDWSIFGRLAGGMSKSLEGTEFSAV
jgi:hypothetical protein